MLKWFTRRHGADVPCETLSRGPSLRRKAQGWDHSRAPKLFRVASLFAAGSGNLAKNSVVFLLGARLAVSECDHDVAAHILNTERSVVGRQVRIEKPSSRGDAVKMPVKNFDSSAYKVGGIESWTLRGCRQC